MAEAITPRELAQFVPLNALSPENLKEISRKARRVSVPAGHRLFQEGDSSAAHFFLLNGRIQLNEDEPSERIVEAGQSDARGALDGAGNHVRNARAVTDSTVLAVDRDLLDLMLTWDQTGSYHVEDLSQDLSGPADDDWMTRLLQTDCFRRIPPANIQAIFMRMVPAAFDPGDIVIRQGDAGDYFYIIQEGRCLVTRATAAKPEGIRLAELGPGDSFGEEALIADGERNATVTMVSRGTLMRMSKEDFHSLLTEPLLQWIDYEEAMRLSEKGAQWIDVRLPGEYESGHLQGAQNLPLFFLRMKAQKLDPATTHIIYCDTGRRSSAASFLLSERGFDTRVLRGGSASIPADAMISGRQT